MEQAAPGPRCGGRRRARLAARQGKRGLAPVRRRQPERDHARRAVLRRRQRLHPDLRAHARREHGPRLALPARRLPGARDAGRLVHPGQRARPLPDRGGERRVQPLGLGRPAPARHRHHRGDRRADPADLPALEPGAGSPPGADHDRPVGDLRRPDARGLRGNLEGHPDPDRLAREHHPSRRCALRILPRRDRARRGDPDRARPLVADHSHALRQDRPGRRGRSRHGLGAGDQRPARLRGRVLPRRAAGRAGGSARRHDDLPGSRRGHVLSPELADRRDHRRDGVARRRGDRRAGARPRGRLRRRLPRLRRHRPHQLLDPRDVRPSRGRAGGTAAGPVRETRVTGAAGRTSWPALAVVAVLAALAPLVFTDFFVSVILTKSLWLGVAAASLIFLSAYGGLVSLAQVGIYGVAGMAYANLVAADGGSAAEWAPWLATIAALAIATLVGLFFGALSSRSEGIYFLMITLAFSVLVYYFFSQVTELSGFGGVNNVELPALLGDPVEDAAPRYWVTLVVAALVFLGLRAIARTPFGLVLQGQRDEPARMNPAQRADAPNFHSLAGKNRLEGAWVGALVYALIDNYSRDWVPHVGNVLGPARFNTVIGAVFLTIVLASPNGLMGLGQNAWDRLRRRGAGTGRPPPGTGAGLAEQPARGAV